MVGFKRSEANARPSATPLGVLDRMSWRNAGNGAVPFRSLPLIDQHTVLMKAWKEKGNSQKAQRNASEVVEEKMKVRDYQGAADIAFGYSILVINDPDPAACERVTYKRLVEQSENAARQLHWEMMRGRNFEAAEKIAEKYSLYDAQYGHKMRKGREGEYYHYYDALHLAKTYDLGEGKIREAALGIYNYMFQNRAYHDAARVAKRSGMVDEMKIAASKSYERLMSDKRYLEAAHDADFFGLEELAKGAALKAYKETVWFGKSEESRAIKDKFKLELKDMQDVALDVCENSIRFERSARLVRAIAEEEGIAGRIGEVALKVYHEKIQKGEYDKATQIAKDYGLQSQEQFLMGLASVLGEKK